MAGYAWRGRNHLGELVTGTLEADDESMVATHLLASGLTPVDIRPAAAGELGGPPSWWESLLARRVTLDDQLLLTRQLYTLQKSGVPILRSLAGLQASSDHPSLVRVLQDLRNSLDQGKELSTAMRRHEAVFGPFYTAMVKVGEMTGQLTEVFSRLGSHLEFEIDTRARVKQALRYPTMVLVSIGLAIIIINLFVLPTFAAVFAGFKTQLPLLTRLLLGFSAWMRQWWPALLVGALGLIYLARYWVSTPDGRYRWDRLKLRLPIAGPIVLKATLARFARSFSLASRSGVPISQAMTVVAQTAGNAFIAARIEQMRNGIERGESISRCAASAGVFTPIVLQMIAVGEETGELDALMNEIAGMYERETDAAIKGLSAAIEPILLLVVGAMVTMLALGVFLPLWSMGQAAMGRGG